MFVLAERNGKGGKRNGGFGFAANEKDGLRYGRRREKMGLNG